VSGHLTGEAAQGQTQGEGFGLDPSEAIQGALRPGALSPFACEALETEDTLASI
jgi:hypothetical protein